MQEVEQYQLKDADKKTACEKQKQRPLMTPCQLIDRHDSKSCVDIWFSCPDRFHPTKEFDEVGLGLCYRANDWVLLSYERID